MTSLSSSDREYRERKHNEKAKKLARTISQNLYTYLCIAIPFLLICTIWTEFTLPKVGWGLMGDGILTIALMVIGERLMVKIGTYGGKLDEEYEASKKRYKIARTEAKKRFVPLMMPFCEWQIDQEFERAKRARCSKLRIKYDDYTSKYEGKTLEELKKIFPLEKAVAVDRINQLEPIELTPDILLYGCGRRDDRRDIPQSGEEYEEEKIYGKRKLIVSIITCIICVGLPLAFCSDITISDVIYTLGKLAVLLYRMFKGYSDGAKAYHTVEVRHLDSKSDYLEEFVIFVDEKQYLLIANEYTQIRHLMGLDSPEKEKDNEVPRVKSVQERAGYGNLGSQPHTYADKDYHGDQPRGADRRGDHDVAECAT